MTRRLLVLTTSLFALCAPSASAATICVPFGTGCDAVSVSLQGAIDIANLDPAVRDTIRINASYEVTENASVQPANLVDIIGGGGGPGGTVLRSPNASHALDIQSPGSTVANLRVRVENQVGIGEAGLGLSAAGATADGITVIGEAGVEQAAGVHVRAGAILRNSFVQMPLTGNANDALKAEENTLIENVSAAGDNMLDARDPGPPVVVRRLRSSNPSAVGVTVSGMASVQISDSLIRLSGGPSGGGLVTDNSFGGNPSIIARHLSVIGTGSPTEAGTGVDVGGFSPGETSTVDIRDSIFHALSTDLRVEAGAGANARIPIDHSNYDPAKVSATGAGSAQVVPGASNVLVNPGFVDGAAADFRLRADSPLVDRGFPGAGSTSDLDGQPRPNDGNGDGTAVRDIGAFEYQRAGSPPPPPVDTSAPLFRILSKRLKLSRRGRVAVVLRGPSNETAASRASVGLRRGRRLGRKSISLRPSARTTVRVKLSRRNARRVRRAQKLRVALTVTARDTAGNARTVRKRVTLRA